MNKQTKPKPKPKPGMKHNEMFPVIEMGEKKKSRKPPNDPSVKSILSQISDPMKDAQNCLHEKAKIECLKNKLKEIDDEIKKIEVKDKVKYAEKQLKQGKVPDNTVLSKLYGQRATFQTQLDMETGKQREPLSKKEKDNIEKLLEERKRLAKNIAEKAENLEMKPPLGKLQFRF